MREWSWIAVLLLCMGWCPVPLLGTNKTGKSSTDVNGTQPAHIRAAVGGSVTLSCSFTYFGHINDVRFERFYTENETWTSIGDNVTCRPHVPKEAKLHCYSSLTINNIRPENETIYYCAVKIPRAKGSIEWIGPGTNVSLYSDVSSIGIEPSSLLVSGSKGVLTCVASRFYPRNVSVLWFHGETPVRPGNVTNGITKYRDGTFSLRSSYRFRAHARDHGVRCRCQVSHPAWTCERSANVTLEIGYGPSSVNLTSDSGQMTQGSLRLPVGSPLSITCMADGNPRPETLWVRGSVKALHVGKTLQLDAVQEEHNGTYWCMANNSFGEMNASFTLLVFESQASPGSLGPVVICLLGTVLMILVGTSVCLLAKRMKRSQAQGRTDTISDGAISQEGQGALPVDAFYSVLEISNTRRKGQKPAPHAVDESQLIYADIRFPLASRNQNTMEATDSPIYSAVMRREAGAHRGARSNCQQKPEF
ncbi:hypothetical protein SKAU_G00324780 [Synaphobranchus kaupii]|uniref:Ig-like domain-containing protein n=1 Tax=Synaphobranchus kaupii TaxID=118154 RepID=A0A9Q1EPI0_SYNKA|nr:hypothetical protein SKAU_G00324780 [Synaphobranchus kaupii]